LRFETDSCTKGRRADKSPKKHKEHKAVGVWSWAEDVYWWMHLIEASSRWNYPVKRSYQQSEYAGWNSNEIWRTVDVDTGIAEISCFRKSLNWDTCVWKLETMRMNRKVGKRTWG